METTKPEYMYFESKMNLVSTDTFEIHESIIGFDHGDFRGRIKDELSYLGMEYSELAFKCYISSSRMMYLLTKTTPFLPSEIKSIKKILGM